MEWDDLRHVAALVEHGSVRRAGAALGVHGATVARRVERLEQQLGVRLFVRTRDGMVPTEAGLRAAEVHGAFRTSLDSLEREIRTSATAMSGAVTLLVSEALGAGWIVPRLSDFFVRHPDVQLCVETAAEVPSLAPGRAEAALLVTTDPPEDLVGRRLGEVAICGYRQRRTVASEAPPTERLLGPLLPELSGGWRDSGREPCSDASLRCAALADQVAACRVGIGMAVLPCVLGDAMPDLERVAPAEPVPAGDGWLLSHPDSRGIARLQALLGYIQEIWTTDRARLEGRLPRGSSATHD